MLIPIAPFPPPPFHPTIPETAYALWATTLTLHLQLPPTKFISHSLTDTSLITFLATYLHYSPPSDSDTQKTLKRKVATLLHRVVTLPEYANLPGDLTTSTFIRNVAASFPRSRVLRSVFDEERVWRRYEAPIEKLRRVVVVGKGATADDRGLEVLFRFSRRAAEVFLASDDWLDVAVEKNLVEEFKIAVLEVAGVDGIRKGNWSMVTDIIYGLIAASDNPKASGFAKEKGFLKALVGTTSFVATIKRAAKGTPEEGRIENVLKALERFGRPRGPKRRVVDSGKGKERMIELSEEEEMEVMNKVSIIRDLFPDLGSEFVRRCLDEFGGDVERVTGALLEHNLPPTLLGAERNEEHTPPNTSHTTSISTSIQSSYKPTPTASSSTLLPSRRSIYDNDSLDTFQSSALSRLHFGRKTNNLYTEKLLSTNRVSKSSIFAALDAFDSDDDERDDTYDIADVGGAVDNTGEEDIQKQAPEKVADTSGDAIERTLWETYKKDASVFGRDSETRRGAARKQLKQKTEMTDEAIEGWKVMLEREPKRLRILEQRFSDLPGGGGGRQSNILESTRWTPPADGEEDSWSGDRRGGRPSRGGRVWGGGRGGGRGRGGGGRGDGGNNLAGPSGDRETTQGRARKEANKGSRANHNRRDQRARKMARGGAFPPAG